MAPLAPSFGVLSSIALFVMIGDLLVLCPVPSKAKERVPTHVADAVRVVSLDAMIHSHVGHRRKVSGEGALDGVYKMSTTVCVSGTYCHIWVCFAWSRPRVYARSESVDNKIHSSTD
jgi:hypothetical protein